jgi:hypothetical protein
VVTKAHRFGGCFECRAIIARDILSKGWSADAAGKRQRGESAAKRCDHFPAIITSWR